VLLANGALIGRLPQGIRVVEDSDSGRGKSSNRTQEDEGWKAAQGGDEAGTAGLISRNKQVRGRSGRRKKTCSDQEDGHGRAEFPGHHIKHGRKQVLILYEPDAVEENMLKKGLDSGERDLSA